MTAAAIVVEYRARTEAEAGRTMPRTPTYGPPAPRPACSSRAARDAPASAVSLAQQGNATIGCVAVRPVPKTAERHDVGADPMLTPSCRATPARSRATYASIA